MTFCNQNIKMLIKQYINDNLLIYANTPMTIAPVFLKKNHTSDIIKLVNLIGQNP